MSLDDVKALTFDTGGTILDWHTGFSNALAKAGAKHGLEKDWPAIANELRRRSLGLSVNMGKEAPPDHNHDGSHRMALDAVIAENGLDAFTEEDRHDIAYTTAHNLQVWPDFPAVLPSSSSEFASWNSTAEENDFLPATPKVVIATGNANGLMAMAEENDFLGGALKVVFATGQVYISEENQ